MASLIGKADPTLVAAAYREGVANIPGDYSKQFGIMADANKTLLEGVDAAWKMYETDKKTSKKELEDAVKDLRTYGVGIENNADYNMFSDEMDTQVAIWKENGGFQNDSKGLREWERQNNKIMGKYKSNQTALIEAMEAFEDSNSWIDGLEPGDNKFLTSLTKYAKNVDDKSGTHNAKANDYMANNTGASTDKKPEDLWRHLRAKDGEMVKYLDPTTNEFVYITSVDGEVISKKSSEISKMIPKKAITTETTIQGRLNDIAKNPTGTYTANDSLMNQNWLERVIDEAVQKGESLQYLMNQKYGGMEESFADSLRNGTAAITPAIIQSLSDLGYTVEDQAKGEEGHGVLDKNDFMAGTNYNAIVNEILNGEDTYELRRDLFIDKLDNEVFRHEAEQVSKKIDNTDYGMAMPKHLGGRHRSNETVRDQANKLQTYGKGRNIVMADDNYTVVEPGKTFKGSDGEIYTLQQVWDNNAMPSGLKKSVTPSKEGETPKIDKETDEKINVGQKKGKKKAVSTESVIEASDLTGITKRKTWDMTRYYNYEGKDINAANKALSQAKGTTGINDPALLYYNDYEQISKRQYEKLKDKSKTSFKVQIGVDKNPNPTPESKYPTVTNEMINNNYTGQGTISTEGSSGGIYKKYEGEFKDGKRHGQGTVTFDDGDMFVGEFKNDETHGKGVWTFGESKNTSSSWYWEGEDLNPNSDLADGGEKEFLKRQKASETEEVITEEVTTEEVTTEVATEEVATEEVATEEVNYNIDNPHGMFGTFSQSGDQMVGLDGEYVSVNSEEYFDVLGIKSSNGKDFVKGEGVMKKVSEIAGNHGFNVRELLNVIQKESNFNPAAVNEKSGATGLIQFFADKGEDYKTIDGTQYKIADIKKMSVNEQLNLIDKYFEENHKQGQHPYITIAYPKAHNMNMDEIIATSDSTIAKQNPVWVNDDGNVTKRSIIAYADKV